MTESELRKSFQDWVFRGSAYRMALSVIGYDRNTVAPRGGAEYREKRTAYLSGELFRILQDPKIEPVLQALSALPEAEESDAREYFQKFTGKNTKNAIYNFSWTSGLFSASNFIAYNGNCLYRLYSKNNSALTDVLKSLSSNFSIVIC